jgi:hypothetical protein
MVFYYIIIIIINIKIIFQKTFYNKILRKFIIK